MPYKNIVILTGAGISAESGISTFRDSDGLWEKHRVEDVATPEGYERNPELVLSFYNMRRKALKDVEPNAAHLALAALEKEFDGNVLLVTQNVDNLHERAGSDNLIHMHGELTKVRCSSCSQITETMDDITPESVCPSCGRKSKLRPHIVWFGEMPFQMDEITTALSSCDLFLSIGTSGNVYPAASFVQYAAMANAHTVELNLEDSAGATRFAERIYGKATEVVPAYVVTILGK